MRLKTDIHDYSVLHFIAQGHWRKSLRKFAQNLLNWNENKIVCTMCAQPKNNRQQQQQTTSN